MMVRRKFDFFVPSPLCVIFDPSDHVINIFRVKNDE
jgi:hypothetical protein